VPNPSFSTPRHRLFPEFVRQHQSTMLIRRTARMEPAFGRSGFYTIFRSPSCERTCTGVLRPSRFFSAASAFFTTAASAIAAEKATLPLVAMVFTSLKPQASKAFLRSSIVTAHGHRH